ncbi:MAG: DUF177 domain-containing protein [Chitinivibrionales bacterium]|nr:DUF177 domain-containing protein [Chitinivibrionales bacterium]
MMLAPRKIPDGHSEQTQTVVLCEENREKAPTATEVLCRARIDRLGDTIYIECDYSTSVALECSRCLKPVTLPLAGTFTIICKETATGAPRRDETEEVDFFFDGDCEELDISAALADEIMTALPLKPLCCENCPGLATADAPRENSPKSSETESVDPRWNALKKFRKI